MSQTGWRKWHRWVGFAAAPFLLYAAITGIIAGATRVPSEDEEARETGPRADQHGEVAGPTAAWSDPIARRLPAPRNGPMVAPIDHIALDFKPTRRPSPCTSANRRAARTTSSSSTRAPASSCARRYEDKPFLMRLHSGEDLATGRLVLGMAGDRRCSSCIVTGLVIYLAMRKPGRTGLRRVFW